MLNSSPFLSPEVCWANMNTENPLMLLSEVSWLKNPSPKHLTWFYVTMSYLLEYWVGAEDTCGLGRHRVCGDRDHLSPQRAASRQHRLPVSFRVLFIYPSLPMSRMWKRLESTKIELLVQEKYIFLLSLVFLVFISIVLKPEWKKKKSPKEILKHMQGWAWPLWLGTRGQRAMSIVLFFLSFSRSTGCSDRKPGLRTTGLFWH